MEPMEPQIGNTSLDSILDFPHFDNWILCTTPKVQSAFQSHMLTCYCSASLFFGLLRPYKESWVNYLDSVVMMLFSLAEFAALYDQYVTKSHFVIVTVVAFFPLVYLIVYTSYKILSRTAILRRCVLRCMNRCDEDGRALSVGDVEREM